MPLHTQARSLLDLMTQTGARPFEESTPEQARADREALARPPIEDVHDIRDLDAGGVPARLYRPSDRTGLGLLVFFHGGGWVIGDLESHDGVCRSLANRSGHAVLSIGYRLAPEHPFPQGLEDCIAATRWASANAGSLGCDAERLAIGGDSAGANLAAVVTQLAPVPLRFQLLVYPVADARQGSQSYIDNASGYFLTTSGMSWFIDHYLSGGNGAVDDPRVSPLLGDDAALHNSPPTLVITAEFDPLRDEGAEYARRLSELGIPTSHVSYAGMFHGFFSMLEFLDDAGSAHALAAQALKTALER